MVDRIIFRVLSVLCFSISVSAIELDRIVAIVDDDVVMRSELDQQLNRVRGELRQNGSELPPTEILERQVMERLILEKIQLQLAEQAQVSVTEDNLDQAISDIAKKNNLSLPEFKEILRSDGYDFVRFRQDIRQEIILAKLRREEVERKIQVSEREIANELSSEQGDTDSDVEYDVSHILISVPSNSTDDERAEARERAELVLKRLAEGSEFGDLAIATSDAQDALDKGELGWRKIEEIPSLLADAVQSLEIGTYSGVITSPNGLHIVKLNERRSGEKIMLEQTHVRHILITPSELVTEDEALERLRQLRLRLDSGDDFASVARTHSDDRGSALQGGDLGWVSKGQMVPEFEEVMLAMQPKELSAPFRSEFGWHVMEVLERRTYDGTDEVRRARAREAILARKREEAYQEWQRRLRDEAYVELRTQE
ncbi:MAG: molecular chaperone SurA [Gammaproteobacteria bacterium]|nr:molecular chaperone SurA [Gammaproteobacteria bacterium]